MEIHKSQIETFRQCGLKFKFKYLDRIKRPANFQQTVGIAFHEAVAHNFKQKIKTGTDVAEDEVLDAFSDELKRRVKETDWGDSSPAEQQDVGVECVKAHHRKVAPSIQPMAVEERFLIKTNAGYNLGGTIDIIEQDSTIRDSKTSNAHWKGDEVLRSVEPALYDFAFRHIYKRTSKKFVYDVVKKPTSTMPATVKSIEGKVTKADHRWLFEVVEVVHRSIRSGVFVPASEDSWWCQKNWCEYWSICRGKKR